MKFFSLLKPTLLGTAALAAFHAASAQNVWLAEPGTLSVTPNYSYQSYDEFYAGTAKSADGSSMKWRLVR